MQRTLKQAGRNRQTNILKICTIALPKPKPAWLKNLKKLWNACGKRRPYRMPPSASWKTKPKSAFKITEKNLNKCLCRSKKKLTGIWTKQSALQTTFKPTGKRRLNATLKKCKTVLPMPITVFRTKSKKSWAESRTRNPYRIRPWKTWKTGPMNRCKAIKKNSKQCLPA